MASEAIIPKVIVAGSLIMDLVLRVPHHPAVGETIVGHDFRTFPGGKGANQAVAAARAGAEVQMLGRRGADEFGNDLVAFLSSAGVDTKTVSTDAGAATGVGLVAVADDGANAIIIVPGANDTLRPDALSSLAISPGDMAVAQLEIPFDTIEAFFTAGRSAGARTVLNAAPASQGADRLLHLADILVVNEVELAHFADTDVDPHDQGEVATAVRRLRAFDGQIVIVTLGAAGLTAFVDDEEFHVPGRNVRAIDTTGAGDCFAGSLAALLTQGAPLQEALHFANAAASLSVQTEGAGPSMPTRAQVDDILK